MVIADVEKHTLGTEGHDCFGYFTYCTGYENSQHCWWCDKKFPDKRRRRFCGEDCRHEYFRHFLWPWAATWCLERYDQQCNDCSVGNGTKIGEGWQATQIHLLAHHIIPLNGQKRTSNILNRPNNLVALCPSCHGKRHAAMKEPAPGIPGYKVKGNGYPPAKCPRCWSPSYWLLEWQNEEGYDPLLRKCRCRRCDNIYYLAPIFYQEKLL